MTHTFPGVWCCGKLASGDFNACTRLDGTANPDSLRFRSDAWDCGRCVLPAGAPRGIASKYLERDVVVCNALTEVFGRSRCTGLRTLCGTRHRNRPVVIAGAIRRTIA